MIAKSIRLLCVQGAVIVKQLDLADLTKVQACAEDINQTEPRLDLLILNAGIMMTPLGRTAQGLEQQIGGARGVLLKRSACCAFTLPVLTFLFTMQ